MAQETLIQSSGVPFTIVRATQFFEFIGAIADSGTKDGIVRMPSALMQPMVSDDVAAAVADVALAEPVNGTVEVAGPEPFQIDEIVRQFLAARSDPREVITDEKADYYGIPVSRTSLMPGPGARLGATRFADWLRRTTAAPRAHATVG
jgi:uncharacterized protein YbjT (DUF2867 family)